MLSAGKTSLIFTTFVFIFLLSFYFSTYMNYSEIVLRLGGFCFSVSARSRFETKRCLRLRRYVKSVEQSLLKYPVNVEFHICLDLDYSLKNNFLLVIVHSFQLV